MTSRPPGPPLWPSKSVRRFRLIADSPGLQRRLASVGLTVIPPWSPEAAWLVEPSLSDAVARERWITLTARRLLMAKYPPAAAFVAEQARWLRPPLHARLIWQDADSALFELSLP